jgi:diguanylate cyclase (GGDEF)-like protein
MKRIRKLRDFILINNMLSVIIPLLIAGVMIIPFFYNYAVKQVYDKNTMMATTIAQRLSDFMQESFYYLYQLDDLLNQNAFKNQAEVLTALNTILRNSNSLEGFEVLDKNGLVVVNAPENANILGTNRASQPYFSETKSTGKAYVSSTFISPQTGKPTITIAIPHQDGVLVAYLNLEEISLISVNLIGAFGDAVTVAVTDNNGVYISNKAMEKVYQRELEPNRQLVHQENDSGMLTGDYDGQTMMISYAAVAAANWHVFVYQSYASLLSAFEPFLAVMALLLVLTLIFSRMIARVFFQDIGRSFSELNQQTNEVATGDYHPIDVDTRFDEFKMLTENFNHMVVSVRERDETLKQLAYYDSQTGLPNAAYLAEALAEQITGRQPKIAVICFDIQNFKRINDTFGPSFGDQVLAVMGQRLQNLAMPGGFVARSNGTNFVRILTDFEQPETIIAEINRLKAVIGQRVVIHDNHLYLRFHIGVALYPEDAKTVEELLQYANTAADAAKQRGAAQFAFFEDTMKQDLTRNMQIENCLRTALAGNEFYLHYQPQIDMKSQSIRGFEALLRWENEKLGRVSPLDFIAIAEATGLIVPIGAWVLETACRQMVKMNAQFGGDWMISVNVSPVQLSHERFPEMVEAVLTKTGLAPALLELEITENLFIHSYDEAIRIFKRLKKLGIKMSLDDFGTGYSSLAYLKNLPIDTLKIDQAFTRDLLIKKSNEQLMESIIVMAHTLDLDVIVEGVEEEEQLDCLKDYHCDHVQGYYFSRPIAEAAIAAFYRQMTGA